MPDIDGIETTETIRRHPEYADCPVVLLSSAVTPDLPVRCQQSGIAGHLTKPVIQAELFNMILRVLGPLESSPLPEVESSHLRASRPLLILLAEDSPVNQKVAVGILNLMGHEVTIANNGRESVTNAAERTFDLILMDLQMPEVGGLEATKLIRENEMSSGQHIPIIAMTAAAMKGDKEKCLDAGMDDYLSKPIKSEQLSAMLERFCQTNQQATQGDIPPDSSAETVPRPKANDLDLFDLETFVETYQCPPDTVKKLCEVFLVECQSSLETIREGLENQDVTSLKRAAHKLKGEASTITSKRLAAAALHLEEVTLDTSLDNVPDAIKLLEAEIHAVTEVIEQSVLLPPPV